MQIHIEEVPTEIRRRAAQLLETVRGTDMDPTGGKASLTREVTALFRPDIDDVAYYEFAVDLGRGDDRRTAFTGRGDEGAKRAMPAATGFIIAASKGHDHPIAHWSLNREPPSRQIAAAAEAKGSKVDRIFKVDRCPISARPPGARLPVRPGNCPCPSKGCPMTSKRREVGFPPPWCVPPEKQRTTATPAATHPRR
ncbi:hypothetical protein ACFQFQ_07360 [Sulfitobacter porphyrae]|uniref:Uncharacterized protein n=1 Tax=Sulfitobacter porphyrae TaxID=1246864 RepID=A0ABW2B0Z1_9RHOB